MQNRPGCRCCLILFAVFFSSVLIAQQKQQKPQKPEKNDLFFQTRLSDPSNTENAFYFTGYRSENSEAGIITYKRFSPYGNITMSPQPFFFRAGYLSKTPYNGFLLSNGGYFPYYESLPYKQPFGFRARFQPEKAGKYFDLTMDRYVRNRSVNMEVNQNEKYELTTTRLNLRYSLKRFRTQISGTLFSLFQKVRRKNKTDYGFLLFASLTYHFNAGLLFQIDFSYSPLLGEIFQVEFRKADFKIAFFDSRPRYKNPFASELYEKQISQFILSGKEFSWKGGYVDADLFSKGSYEHNGFGALFYSSESNENYIGIYHYFEKEYFLPAFSYYRNPEHSDYMYSIGAGIAKKARISYVHMHSSRGRSYPLDPAFFPVSLYNDNLREDMSFYFSGKKKGVELFLATENIQLVGVYLQPFRPKRRSDLYYEFRVNIVTPLSR
ncbi:MAG: hypothetical protein ABUK01_00085 [Leptospirales bacterium]